LNVALNPALPNYTGSDILKCANPESGTRTDMPLAKKTARLGLKTYLNHARVGFLGTKVSKDLRFLGIKIFLLSNSLCLGKRSQQNGSKNIRKPTWNDMELRIRAYLPRHPREVKKKNY
jgi:hypothetical protein